MSNRFFSIIVPAHNEELIIERTLGLLEALDYSKDRYEVIVVENGSTDATYEKAQLHESDRIKVFSPSFKGVSRARNFGFTKASPEAEWIIFMDCDVFLKASFLSEVNAYLEAHPEAGYGTTTVNLDSDSFNAKFWSRFNNFTYRLSKFLFTIHIVRKDLALKVSYDEDLVSGEDVAYGKELAKLGKYFFIKTTAALASPRRFKKKGYFVMFFVNTYRGFITFILPKRISKNLHWEVIR